MVGHTDAVGALEANLKLSQERADAVLRFLVKEGARLPQMNAVHIPEAIQSREAEVRKTLLSEFGLEIGAGLGPLAGGPQGLEARQLGHQRAPVAPQRDEHAVGRGAIVATIGPVITPAAEQPRKTSAPFMASARVRFLVSTAHSCLNSFMPSVRPL